MLNIDNQSFNSRFLLGTAGYPSLDILSKSIAQSETEIITVSLTRVKFNTKDNQFFNFLNNSKCKLLPNTAGCFSAQDAIDTALLAQEVFGTNWIKLEVIGDDYMLTPNSFELLRATETLIELGFVVFPYCIDDIVICNELVNLGCKILMPMGSPIGSGQGLLNLYNLTTLRNKFPDTILIVDSGIGSPSDATEIMELGYDAVLLNSAVSQAVNSIQMAKAFNLAIKAGHLGFRSGIIPKRNFAVMSTPHIDKPFIDNLVV